MTADPSGRLIALRDYWREQARKDARYGVANAMMSGREYYGTVNAAFTLLQCADELDGLITALPRPQREAVEQDKSDPRNRAAVVRSETEPTR